MIEHAVAPVPLVEPPVHISDLPMPLQQHALGRVGARLEVLHSPRCVRFRRHELLLRVSDHREERIHEVVRAERVPQGVRAQLLEYCGHVQPALCGVGDANGGRGASQPSPVAHHTICECVIRGQRRLARKRPVCRFRAFAHLGGGLVRVCEHKLLLRGEAAPGERDEALDDDASLSASRTGEDEARPLEMVDRALLLRVGGDVRFERRRARADHLSA